MSDCIFCKIIKWELPCAKIWEDENFVAILDAFPNRKWMTLIMPKKHTTSNFANTEEQLFSDIMKASHKVANILKKWLNVKRVGMVVWGLEVPHLHIKLYPFNQKQNWQFDGFENWINSWPQEDMSVLQNLAKTIIANNS